MKFNLKALLPHLFAIGIFLVVTLFFCKPALDGRVIEQHDLIQWKGMAQDAFNYKDSHGTFPLWTTSLFSGMPSYNIAFQSNAYLPEYFIRIMSLGLPTPFNYFFLACICFYFLTQVLRLNSWIGILASIGFAFCSYNPIIVAVGHHTKMITIALMPGLLASLLLLFNKKYWIGAALISAFTAALVVNNHLQVIYYMLLVVLFCAVSFLISWIRQGEIKHILKVGTIGILSALLGSLTCSVNLFTTYDYSKESMRGGKATLDMGKSDSLKKQTTTGLDAEYAFRWSYGKLETFSLLIPNVNGGVSESLSEESKFYETLMSSYQSGQIDQQFAQQLSRFGVAYWGDQPFTSGPVYLGAIICLLFVLGMVAGNTPHAWWALACSTLAILMAWGSHLAFFNNFLFEYLPFYNKFRAPAMILVIPQLLFPMIGAIGLQNLLFGNAGAEQKRKYLKNTGIVLGVLFLLAIGYFFSSDFRSQSEQETITNIIQSNPTIGNVAKSIINAAGEDRKTLFINDFTRSLILAGLGFVLLFAFVSNKIKAGITLIALLLLSSIDLLNVSRRYLKEDNYQDAENLDAASYVGLTNKPLFNVLNEIKKDPDPHFRVLNLTVDVFNDALTSTFVRSVGGYHPAKLSLYQDIIEYQLSNASPNLQVLNMLDTKYVIVQGDQGPVMQQNPGAFGAAWLTKAIHYVKDAAEEMDALNKYNLKDTAIVQESFKNQIIHNPQWDSSANIRLSVYDNDAISYSVNAPGNQFAVLSEIFYSKGWKAFADGKEIPIIKTNYALRGVSLPAGTQKLDLKFEPESYTIGATTTNISSVIILIVLLGGIFMEYKLSKKANKTAS